MERHKPDSPGRLNGPGPPEGFLARVLPVLRGALAEPSGCEDDPYRRCILDFSAGETPRHHSAVQAQPAGAGSRPPPPPLELPPFTAADPPEAIRAAVQKAVAGYRRARKAAPRLVFLPGAGVVTVRQDAGRPEMPLTNKVALVTGAAGAIGAAICEALLQNGCRVAAGDLPGERLDGLVRELDRPEAGRVTGVPLDVTAEDSVSAAFNRVILQWGGVDLVIINAGVAMVAGLTEMDLEAFRQQERVNIEGTLLTLSEAGRCLSRQGTGGDIVLISTKNVFAPGAQFGAYSATKAAAHQLCRIASQEFAADQIRVNMVAPDAVFAHGARRSGLWEAVGPDRMRRRGLDAGGLEEYYRSRNLLKARVTARHVANAVLFFVTRQTPTTGATIPVDGGLPDATPR
jgi:NAD(P)-dependent dehydrogenase (short-subunit alcohol dehydrogenase family)